MTHNEDLIKYWESRFDRLETKLDTALSQVTSNSTSVKMLKWMFGTIVIGLVILLGAII